MRFAAEWTDAASERADAQSFWVELFAVFGIRRRSVASFEEKVKNLTGAYDRIDVFYAGVMLGEHKSRGQDLSKAASQGFDYVQSLEREGRANEVPQYIVVSDFDSIAVYDLDSKDPSKPAAKFATAKLHENINHLGFLSGYTTKPVDPEDPINIEAVQMLGRLHTALERGQYTGHRLERFLVRVLFCLFADDTAIFENEEFKALVKSSRADGSDLGALLARFFKVLDQAKESRPPKLPEDLRALPYVNGVLFKEDLGFADFDGPMRTALIECCEFNWSRISPAVFGSLFQSIMAGDVGKVKRRQIGAHYTSERDIMKLLRSLFLDDLKADLAACGREKKKLAAFQDKLASLRFLDPACGCGNFLVVAYRELRVLELETVVALHGGARLQDRLNLDAWLKVDVDQMHGIEIEEWPARIAEVAMWLIDHQMNQRVGEAFGRPVVRLPLRKSASIRVGNALRIGWNDVLPAKKCSFVLGNPPFIGHQWRSAEQQRDHDAVWTGVHRQAGRLDYVACWYLLAAKYMKGDCLGAFVSTNSITQGEQARILAAALWGWGRSLFIHWAHRTFAWESEARGAAHVHVVIVGFGLKARSDRVLVSYDENADGSAVGHAANNINAYLVDGPDVVLESRGNPLSTVPPMNKGSQPTDGGHLVLDEAERTALLAEEPGARKWLRPFLGGEEFLHGNQRWCLWLKGMTSGELNSLPAVKARVRAVRADRLKSPTRSVRDAAETPMLFTQDRQPTTHFLAIPEVSSESRRYIPIAFLLPKVVPSNKIQLIANADMYTFGVLSSAMHMAWVRTVCGRLESRLSYSPAVYNNFPWPPEASEKPRSGVESAAHAVLKCRTQCVGDSGRSLADLYDALAMPKALRDAHKALDRAVDKCYRAAAFPSDRARVEYLFGLYQKLTAPLTAPARPSTAVKSIRRRGTPLRTSTLAATPPVAFPPSLFSP